MDTELKEYLKSLAAKYENKEFLIGDPSWFMHHVEGDSNKELLAFIAAALSYGSRKQFLPKIQILLDSIEESGGDVAEWLLSGHYETVVPRNDACFYRLYNNKVFNDFLSALAQIVRENGDQPDLNGSLKLFLQKKMKTNTALEAIELLTKEFALRGSVGVIPKNTQSSCKRVCMFLRWMVRDGSPVDLGIWSDIIDKKTLIIPMDTHVIQEANRLGLLKSKAASMTTAIRLTDSLREIFPDDPLKGDFALFGVGVDSTS